MRSPQNKTVHYRHPQRHNDCQSVRLYKYQTQLKSVFKMSSVCSSVRHCLIISSTNSWWKCFHSSLRWSTSWVRLRYRRSCSFPKSGSLPGSRQDCFAPYHFSCLSTLIKTLSSAKNTMFIVYANCWLRQHNVTSRKWLQ